MIKIGGRAATLKEIQEFLAHIETHGGSRETADLLRACLRMRGVS